MAGLSLALLVNLESKSFSVLCFDGFQREKGELSAKGAPSDKVNNSQIIEAWPHSIEDQSKPLGQSLS